MTMPATILCTFCCDDVALKQWARVYPAVPVVSQGKIVGHVAVLRHRDCRGVSAVAVKV